ncbi:MAG: hypothetical protein R2818_10260 [Flavobacteriales bacterium]
MGHEENDTKASAPDPALRPYPYPYTAWLALSNDPDNTVIAGWRELDQLIWKELQLPFADCLFFRSYNRHLPDQVDLHRYPEILAAHPHDTIHTWGDYMFAGTRGFDRSDAEQAVEHARSLGFSPRVWVDHSMFPGNMLHIHRYGAKPEFPDAAGHIYGNPYYTLDLVRAIGVRYLWDGTITPILGQDQEKNWFSYHLEHSGTTRKGLIDYAKHRMSERLGIGSGFRAQFQKNAAYRKHVFPDGNAMYVFQRHGYWDKAEIHGLAAVIAPERMDELVARGGTCIAYTHLGKRPADRMAEATHIPAPTKAALKHVGRLHAKGELMLSSVSELLDHLVLRDNITVDRRNKHIRFHADGISFSSVGPEELKGRSFTFLRNEIAPEGLQIMGTSEMLHPRIEWNDAEHFTLRFEE